MLAWFGGGGPVRLWREKLKLQAPPPRACAPRAARTGARVRVLLPCAGVLSVACCACVLRVCAARVCACVCDFAPAASADAPTPAHTHTRTHMCARTVTRAPTAAAARARASQPQDGLRHAAGAHGARVLQGAGAARGRRRHGLCRVGTRRRARLARRVARRPHHVSRPQRRRRAGRRGWAAPAAAAAAGGRCAGAAGRRRGGGGVGAAADGCAGGVRAAAAAAAGCASRAPHVAAHLRLGACTTLGAGTRAHTTGSSLEGVLEIKCPYKASPGACGALPARADAYYMPQVCARARAVALRVVAWSAQLPAAAAAAAARHRSQQHSHTHARARAL
jgi:hypothetical protein